MTVIPTATTTGGLPRPIELGVLGHHQHDPAVIGRVETGVAPLVRTPLAAQRRIDPA